VARNVVSNFAIPKQGMTGSIYGYVTLLIKTFALITGIFDVMNI